MTELPPEDQPDPGHPLPARKPAKPVTETWEHVGWVGVDSARLMLTDPCYPPDLPEEFLTSLGDKDGCARWAPGGQSLAMIVLTQNGDGLYPVSVTRDVDGLITAVRADFTRAARTAANQADAE